MYRCLVAKLGKIFRLMDKKEIPAIAQRPLGRGKQVGSAAGVGVPRLCRGAFVAAGKVGRIGNTGMEAAGG